MDDDAFARLMASLALPSLEWRGGVAVGLSGGADSTALTLLLHAWTQAQGIPFLALVCDHGLRPESACEASRTHKAMACLGVPSRILRLRMRMGADSIQERARAARYAAMLQAMRQEGLGILAVGHHLLDQAETVEHRIMGGATAPSALAGMLPVRVAEDALLVRPLLACSPLALRSYLLDRGVAWIEDPSNADTRYARVNIRNALRQAPERVCQLLGLASRNQERLRFIRAQAHARLLEAGHRHVPAGTCHLARPGMLGRDAAAAEALRTMVHRASGRVPSASDEALLRLLSGGGGTLGGAALWRTGHDGGAWISRELSHVDPALPASGHACWDGRIRLGAAVDAQPGALLGALGPEDASALRRKGVSGLPHRVLACMPCLRSPDGTLDVPQLGIGRTLPLATAFRSMPPPGDIPAPAPTPSTQPSACISL